MLKRIIILGCCILALWLGALPAPASAQVRDEVFLPNTDHELHVYRIFGKEPGKTIMIIGGIQGDEPGSYMTADLYADIQLKKGNLIVVPRANLYSIALNRRDGITGDMNRKFGPKDENQKNHMEEEIVSILKHLIAESDCLLNLHEGSGFYSPEWISDEENPKRYGQSIIFDAKQFKIPDTERTIILDDLAQRVVEKVNPQISDSRYHFKVNDHNTLSAETIHLEQRNSATCYALTKAYIPAFGVETSKSIQSLEEKIRLQKLVINTFMAELGIILDAPGINVENPKLDYLLIKVNNGPSYAMPNGSALTIAAGDEVMVTDIVANYQRGLIADIQEVGQLNDTHMSFRIARSTRVVVRKDADICGWVDLNIRSSTEAVGTETKKISVADLRAEKLIINVNDSLTTLAAGQTLRIKKGARLILQDVRSNITQLDNEILINFKGFAPPKSKNDGNDLHFPIYTDHDLWVRYSVDNLGKRYPIEATYQDKKIGEFWVEIQKP